MCPQPQSKPRVVGMMRVRNGEPFLSQALAAAAPLVDAFVVLNDGSTDRTAEICRAHPKVVHCVDQTESTVDEVRDKNRLLKLALEQRPEWILALDADEEIEPGGCEFILNAMASAPTQVVAFSFDFPYFWNDEQHVRFDGPYSRVTRHERIFRVPATAADNLRFEYTQHGSGFHCGSVPQGLSGSCQYLPVKFKHFGYLLPEQRRQKYDFYVQKDPQGAQQGYYNHLIREEGMRLIPWRERADALRAPRPNLPPYYFNLRPELLAYVPTAATRVLELGCATGQLGRAVKERQICHVTGVELNPEAAREALKYFDEVYAADLESPQIAFPESAFDCVICADILEHLADPWATVEKIFRWLVPGGTLVCSIPNVRNFRILKQLAEGVWPYADEGILDRTHLRFFTCHEFEKLLLQARFDRPTIVAIKDTDFLNQAYPANKTAVDMAVGPLVVKNVTPQEFEEFTALQLVFAACKPLAAKPPQPAVKLPAAASVLAGKRMLASIIIPVYNQAGYTAQCLETLSKNTPEHLYNGVIVDNASTDETPQLLQGLSGDVRVIRNAENLGFVKACNLGAQAATNKYLVFLNNDTVPVTGWLEAMLAVMESDETVGAVCAKLVYPDGRLQEAGGIIFSDASGWNFGRGDDIAKPEYCRPCEVDYGSGACLLVRKQLFDQLGGFDERFAPAYYEDVDLCFGIRKLGYKVVFCPQAVIIHFEGMTAGRSLNTGFKQYQARNQKIFAEKWREELRHHAQPPAAPDQIPTTADRTRRPAAAPATQPLNILMVDPFLPWHDRSAGSLRTFQIAKILRRLGHQVTFVARNGENQDHYRRDLEALGVTVYATDKQRLAQMGVAAGTPTFTLEGILAERPYHVAWLDFYELASQYLPDIRRLSPATHLMVDTVDVHFVREQRQAELYKNDDLKKASQETQRKELAAYAQADSLIAVTPADRKVLNEHVPGKPVHILPTIHQVQPVVPPFQKRAGIMFVGTFNHPPNLDAVLYYCRIIHPLVKKQLPDIRVSIIGANPPDVVQQLHNGKDIAVLGYQPDTRPYLEGCRISIAPIRYGAGIKGKICEALSYGLPVVTTPLGAEGLALGHEQHCLIAGTPETFAEAIVRLYRDERLWNALSANGQAFVREHLSEQTAEALIREILKKTAGNPPDHAGPSPATSPARPVSQEKSKRILLVNPHDTEQLGFSNPPLGLLYIASTLLQHGFEVRVVDGCLDGKAGVAKALQEFEPGIVGITCLTPGRNQVLELAKLAKERDPFVTVVLGGVHPTIMYQQLMEHYLYVDLIVLGEGEQTFLEIAQGKPWPEIKGLVYRDEAGIKKTLPRPGVECLDDLPLPAWHLVDLKRYPARGSFIFRGINLTREPRISVVFSRGCKGHCDFCSTWWIWKGWRHRSAKNMVDELELLNRQYGIRHFCFADDALTVDRQATIELCDEILARNVKIAFHATTRTDCVDEEMLRKLHAAGCYQISYGVETGSQKLLEKMGKENDIASAERAIRLSKQAGLLVTALMIIGNVGETRETVAETIAFLRRSDPTDIGCVGGLWILPGTKLYRMCKEQGFIDDDFWLGNEPFKIYTAEWPLPALNEMAQQVMYYRQALPPTPSPAVEFSASPKGSDSKEAEYDEMFRLRQRVMPQALTLDFWKQHFVTTALTACPEIRGRVLDVGCGTGEIDIWLARQLPEITLDAVDFSAVAIGLAEEHRARESVGLQARLRFQHRRFEQLGFTDGYFDACILSHVLEHIPEPASVFREIARVLKPEGRLVIFVPHGHHHDDPSHCWHFEPESLRQLAQQYGQVEKLWESPEKDQLAVSMVPHPARERVR